MTKWIKTAETLINLDKVAFIELIEDKLIFVFNENHTVTWVIKDKDSLNDTFSRIADLVGIIRSTTEASEWEK